ncbi:MAG: RDD family protein [Bdellovibrionales bacterium]|nr:RDD family protein [Bdellovibrionales bacterium]
MQPASFSSRFAAMNLDMLIYTAIWQGVSMVLERNAPELATLSNLIVLSFVFAIGYFVYPTKATGQTLGKKLLGLKVVPQANEKAPVSWGQAFMREIVGKMLSSIPFFLGYLWARFSPDQRAWHDMMSRTHVVSLVYEEEKTTLQKIQQVMLGILSIPLGVALILIAFLYTSMPLDSIKEKIEASGIQVGSLTGSIAGGMHFSEIRRHDQNQDFSLKSVDLKFSLSALVYERIFIIEKLTAEEGHVEVPPDFSWATIFLNLMAIGHTENSDGPSLGNFKMAKMNLKNIKFEHQKKPVSELEEFSVKNLEMADKELRIGEAQFKIPGFTLKTLDFKSAFGRIEVVAATGGMGPEFLPILKAPVDFHIKGAIGKNPKTTKFDGGMTIDKIKFSYEGGKLAMTVDKLLLNEMFKTALPLEDLDMKLSAEGENALEMMSSLNIEYGIKVCGNEFKPDAEQGPTLVRADRQFQFKMMPRPVENFSQVLFSKDATLDQIFLYEIHGKKQMAPHFANHEEMVADLCYQKPVASLQPPELEIIKPLIAAADTIAAGEGLQALLSKAVPITVSRAAAKEAVAAATPAPTPAAATAAPAVSPTPATSPTPVISPTVSPSPVAAPSATVTASVTPTTSPTASPAAKAPAAPVPSAEEQAKAAMSEARGLLRTGKFAEAKATMESVTTGLETLPVSDQGAFYNLKAWVYLYLEQPSEAAHSFEQAFNVRKDISDAEGLLRASEDMKNEANVRKWTEYIRTSLKEHPELKAHLSPNMQKRFGQSSEAAAESHP